LFMLPVALYVLRVALRFYSKKLKNLNTPTHEKCLWAHRCRYYCCGNSAIGIIVTMIVFNIRRLSKCLSMDSLYLGQFVIDVFGSLWLAPCFGCVLAINVYSTLQHKLMHGRHRNKNKIPQCVVALLLIITTISMIFEFACVFSKSLGFSDEYQDRMNWICQNVIRRYVLGSLALLMVSFLVYFLFRLLKITKTLEHRIDTNKDGKKLVSKSMLKNIERLNVRSFYLVMRSLWVVNLIVLLSFEAVYYDKYGASPEMELFFFVLYTFSDSALTIVWIRLIEGTGKSDTIPWLSCCKCFDVNNIFISTNMFKVYVKNIRNSSLVSTETRETETETSSISRNSWISQEIRQPTEVVNPIANSQ